VDAFFEAMSAIRAATDERDLYALKGFHFEKLKGDRGKTGDRSLRMNKQWRLIVRVEQDTQGKLILILDIEKHYNE
jgi:proteic killer suppression protein